MDKNEMTFMQRTAAFNEEAARKNAHRAIRILRAYLDEAERDIDGGGNAGHQAMNMGQHLAELGEASGQLRAIKALSDWLKPTKTNE